MRAARIVRSWHTNAERLCFTNWRVLEVTNQGGEAVAQYELLTMNAMGSEVPVFFVGGKQLENGHPTEKPNRGVVA